MSLLLLVLLPLFGAVLPVLMDRVGRSTAAFSASALVAAALVVLASAAPTVLGGDLLQARWEWMPQAGVPFALRLDGLGLLFSTLILGIGLLVTIYASKYLSKDDPMGRFQSYLLLFMGAMQGVVLADNLLVLVFFWELTSLSSFLLIGFWSSKPEARRGARMALTVTGMGGLALLGGVLVLGHIVGSYDLGTVLASGPLITSHALYLPALGLVLLGVATKSAQFPFHFWLPRAMAAPTPVSSYLHSATMVKAGVFLLARLHPALSGTPTWTWIVGGMGLATMVVGAYLANHKYDLKGLLAYSTISHLGLITALFGFGTRAAVFAALFHIFNHAAFKASLFMNAGIVDHEAGTRDIRQLGGLRYLMPITAVLAIVASASMAGVPPFNGFLSKELFLYQTPKVALAGLPTWIVPAIATLGATLSVAYSIRYVMDVFFGPKKPSYPHKPHDPPALMWGPPALLAAICILVGLFPNTFALPLLEAALQATAGAGEPAAPISLWHGVNAALIMSMIALAVGTGVWWVRGGWNRFHETTLRFPDAEQMFGSTIAAAVAGSRAVTDALQNGSQQRTLALFLTALLVVVGLPLAMSGVDLSHPSRTPLDGPSIFGFVVLLIGVVGTVALHNKRSTSLIFVSTVGLVMSLVFVHFSAPDLALTQLSVEVATIVLLLLALYRLPAGTPDEASKSRHLRDGVLAVGVGLLATVLTWMMLRQPPADAVSVYHLAESKPLGGGYNVVNVILVDFRGFDTMGEVTVLGIAALGIYAMLDGLLPRKPDGVVPGLREDVHPMMMRVLARVMLPATLMVGLYIFLRGHNEPGGGFIAGLVVAIGLVLQYLANGTRWTEARLGHDFQPAIAMGVAIAVLTGVGAVVLGYPFLTTWFQYWDWPVLGKFGLASAMVFDLGVFITVVAVLLLVLTNLSRMRPPAASSSSSNVNPNPPA